MTSHICGLFWHLKWFEALSSIDMLAFCFVAIGSFLAEIYQIPCLTLKIQGQGHGQGQTRLSYLRPRVLLICLLFVSWQSHHFWLRYSKFHIWPWKLKVKVTTKIDQNLSGNQQLCQNWKKSKKLSKSYRVNKTLRPPATYEPVQKHKVTPSIPGWLNDLP